MGDLYFDDIEDEVGYPEKMILDDVRALIKAGQREGPILDYKKDVSERDNWPEAAAAFANSYGGLIIFGVEGQADQPRRLSGLDPRGVEIKAKIVSVLLSHIQPRPDFAVRVVTLDTDPTKTKEVALLRINEGRYPPYMYSKNEQHRVYVRLGSQKAEADYLQLTALVEKRRTAETQANGSHGDLAYLQSQLYVMETTQPGTRSIGNESRFLIGPSDNRAAHRLTLDVERQFEQLLHQVYGDPQRGGHWERTQWASFYRRGTGAGTERRFALTARGGLGFVTHATLRMDDGKQGFLIIDFCCDLVRFLSFACAFYTKARYYGDCLLEVTLSTPDSTVFSQALVYPQLVAIADHLLEPPLENIKIRAQLQTRVALHPLTVERLRDYFEVVMNELMRATGRVLGPGFRASTEPIVQDAIKRLKHAV